MIRRYCVTFKKPYWVVSIISDSNKNVYAPDGAYELKRFTNRKEASFYAKKKRAERS